MSRGVRRLVVLLVLFAAAVAVLPARHAEAAPSVAAVRAPEAAEAGSRYVPVDPVRLADRTLGADALTTDVTVIGGTAAVPADARAVVVNVTGVSPSQPTYVTAYPTPSDGSGPPLASVLNLGPGQIAADLATVRVGDGGRIRLYRPGGSIRLVVDLAGYYVQDDAAAVYVPVSVHRAYDGSVTGSSPVTISRAALGVPSDATAVTLNLTGDRPTVGTYVSAYPAGSPVPSTSSLNLAPGTTRANLVTVRLGAGGVSLYDDRGGIRLIADVQGWYGTAATGATFVPTAPVRTEPGVTLGAGATATESFGKAGVPTGASAVVATVTATEPTAGTYVSLYPAGLAFPGTSNLNVAARAIAPNLAVVPLSTGGAVTVRNAVGSVRVLLDVSGWFVPQTPGHDVSSYQCSGSGTNPSPLPATAFGIVKPSKGLAGSGPNPCLAAQDSWAAASGDEAFYLPLVDYGSRSTLYASPPAGSPKACGAGSSAQQDADPGCAYDYGWNQAASLWGYASSTGHQATRWWLDVEQGDDRMSWYDVIDGKPVAMSTAQNAQVIDGAIAYLQQAGATAIGFYANTDPGNWPQIVGSTTRYASYDEWVSTHGSTAYAAAPGCTTAFGGGPVVQVQLAGGTVDTDLRC